MLACPVCKNALEREFRPEGGLGWRCGEDHGIALTVPVLRRSVEAERLFSILAEGIEGRDDRPCPSCSRSLEVSVVRSEGGDHVLDACRPCQLIWFDRDELESLRRAFPAKPSQVDDAEVRDRASQRRRESMEAGQRISTRGMLFGFDGIVSPEDPTLVDRLSTVAGLPTVIGNPWSPSRHPLTWSLVAVLAVIHLAATLAGSAPLTGLGFVPADAFRWYGSTWLTNFFVHATPVHLMSNIYVLCELGGDAEDELGPMRLAGLLVAGTLVGVLLHTATTSDPTVPLVGASGGLSALLAYYSLRFPLRRVGFLRPVWANIRLRRIDYPVAALFALWLLAQISMLALGVGQVAYAGHLGGAGLGIIAWVLDRRRRRLDGRLR